MVMWYKNGPFHYSLCKWMMLRIEDQYIQFSPSRNPVVFCYTEALKFLFGMIISLVGIKDQVRTSASSGPAFFS